MSQLLVLALYVILVAWLSIVSFDNQWSYCFPITTSDTIISPHPKIHTDQPNKILNNNSNWGLLTMSCANLIVQWKLEKKEKTCLVNIIKVQPMIKKKTENTWNNWCVCVEVSYRYHHHHDFIYPLVLSLAIWFETSCSTIFFFWCVCVVIKIFNVHHIKTHTIEWRSMI